MKNKIFFPIFIFIFSFFIYLSTLSPTVYTGDCGELISSSYNLGIPHPPGYPMFSTLGKLFIMLFPFANIAYRVNLGCCIFSCFTVLLMYLIILNFIKYIHFIQKKEIITSSVDYLAAFSAALCFAFSRTFWSQSVDAEVYALNALFFSAILYFSAKAALSRKTSLSEPQDKYFYIMFFLFGLSLSNHQSMILLLPFLLSVLFLSKNNLKSAQNASIFCFLFLILGAGFNLFLPIRSFANPVIDWGNPESLPNMYSHIFRKQYGSISKLPRSIGLFMKQTGVFWNFLKAQFTFYLLPFALIGIICSIKKYFVPALVLLITYLILTVGAIYILNFEMTAEIVDVVEVFFIPAHFVFCIFMGIGIYTAFRYTSKKLKFSPAFAVILPVLPLLLNYNASDRSNNYFAHDYGINMLNTLEEKSMLFTKGDNQIFPIAYFYMVEEKRNDVRIFDDYGYVFPNIYGDDYYSMTTAQQDTRRTQIQVQKAKTSDVPVYYTAASSLSLPAEIDASGVGMIYRIKRFGEYKKGVSYPWKIYLTRNLFDKIIFQDYLTRNIVAQYHYFLGKYHYSQGDLEKARSEFDLASSTGYDMESMYNNLAVAYYEIGAYEESISQFKKAIEINPNKPEIHWNLGSVYLSMGRYDEAIKKYEDTLKLKINYTDAYSKMGFAYYKKGMIAKAIEETKKAFVYDPGHPESLKNMEFYRKELERNK